MILQDHHHTPSIDIVHNYFDFLLILRPWLESLHSGSALANPNDLDIRRIVKNHLMKYHHFITEVSDDDAQLHFNLIVTSSYHSNFDLSVFEQDFFVLKDALLQSNDLLF